MRTALHRMPGMQCQISAAHGDEWHKGIPGDNSGHADRPFGPESFVLMTGIAPNADTQEQTLTGQQQNDSATVLS